MPAIKDKVRKELVKLVKLGVDIANTEWKYQKEDPNDEMEDPQTANAYHHWYTQALPVVRQLLPDRYEEFIRYYHLEKRKDITYSTYTISDYLIGLRVTYAGQDKVNTIGAFMTKFSQQISILQSTLDRMDSILADINQVLQAELFDDELQVAGELLKKSHLRAAGAVAGVVLERHLNHVTTQHSIPLLKKDPTISDCNDALKNAGVIDVPEWRFIQRLGDIRNLCAHSKEREPTKDEVTDLIAGTNKVIKTIS